MAQRVISRYCACCIDETHIKSLVGSLEDNLCSLRNATTCLNLRLLWRFSKVCYKLHFYPFSPSFLYLFSCFHVFMFLCHIRHVSPNSLSLLCSISFLPHLPVVIIIFVRPLLSFLLRSFLPHHFFGLNICSRSISNFCHLGSLILYQWLTKRISP